MKKTTMMRSRSEEELGSRLRLFTFLAVLDHFFSAPCDSFDEEALQSLQSASNVSAGDSLVFDYEPGSSLVLHLSRGRL